MSDLIAYVEDLESGRRKPTISGIKRVLRNLGKLDRPAFVHGLFESWDEFGDDLDVEWRRYRDPALLARLNAFVWHPDNLPTTAREMRALSGDLSRADALWRRFCALVPEDAYLRQELREHRTGRYPNWPDLTPYNLPFVMRRLPRHGARDPLELDYVDLSVAGFALFFGTTPVFQQWLAKQDVRWLYIKFDVTAGRERGGSRMATDETHPYLGGDWAKAGGLTAYIHLPRQALKEMADTKVNFQERGRRVFSDAMQMFRHETSKAR